MIYALSLSAQDCSGNDLRKTRVSNEYIYICILTLVRKHLQKLKYFEKDLSPSMVVYNYVNDNHYPHNAAQDPKPYLIVVR